MLTIFLPVNWTIVLKQFYTLKNYTANEEGLNFFRESEGSVWKRGGQYTIYLTNDDPIAKDLPLIFVNY